MANFNTDSQSQAIPEYASKLRHNIIRIPEEARRASGILIFGRRLKATQGLRTVGLAKDVESQGALGVVLNAPVSNINIRAVSMAVDIPVVITVINEDTDIQARLNAGASILNVAASIRTPDLVRRIRSGFPNVPIIATGGPTGETIAATVAAMANAIPYTPPSTKEI